MESLKCVNISLEMQWYKLWNSDSILCDEKKTKKQTRKGICAEEYTVVVDRHVAHSIEDSWQERRTKMAVLQSQMPNHGEAKRRLVWHPYSQGQHWTKKKTLLNASKTYIHT